MESGCDEEDGSSRHSSNVTLCAMVHNTDTSDLEWDSNDAQLRSGNKRLRMESSLDDSEEFTTVGKRGKKVKMTTPPALTSGKACSTNPTEYTEVSIVAKEVLPKQIALAKLLNNEKIANIMRIVYKSAFKIVIRFKNLDAAERFLSSDIIKRKGWICRKTNEVNVSYGLVKEVDLDLDDDTIKNILESDVEIFSVKRLSRRTNEGKWVKSESIRICFKGPMVPPYVSTYGIRMRVLPFNFPVTQCSNCWRFGHIKAFCPVNKQLCPKCGGEHENCETVNYRCINCKGAHMSIMKSKCSAFLREKAVRDMMGQSNCTYKMALEKIQEQKKKVVLQSSPDLFTADKSEEKTEIPPIPVRKYSDILKQGNSSSDEDRMSPILNQNKISISQSVKGKKSKRKKAVSQIQELVTPVSLVENKLNFDSIPSASGSGKDNKVNFIKLLQRIKEILNSEGDLGGKLTVIIKHVLVEVKLFIMSFVSMDFLMQFLGFFTNGEN